MGKYLKEADWEKIGPEFLEYVKQDDLSNYLQICREKGMKKEMVATILQIPQMTRLKYGVKMKCDQYARSLQEEFPEEMGRYYWGNIFKLAARWERRKTAKTIGYLKTAKNIYINILKDEASWEKNLRELKNRLKKYSSYPAEELKEL
jgi:hypothetical protein